MATKAEIMAALKAQKEKSAGQGQRTTTSTGDNASYPFWKMDKGQDATIRFLPDGDAANTFFWVKREVLKLPFAGIEGGDYPTTKQVEVTVPCVEMWGETCPVIQAIRPWWQDPAKKDTARTYYKKKSYLYQGFVKQSPFAEENLPENPIRRFVINPTIHEIIENSLMDPDMEDMPTDYVGGTDFRISKTQQGEYANYRTSTFSRRSRSLDEQEMLAIQQHGLFDLKQFLGEKPDADRVAAIKAMFEDSIAGRAFDYASFGQYYRAYGDRDTAAAPAGGAAAAASAPAAATRTFESAAPVEQTFVADSNPAADTAASGGTSPHDILERIKNRTQNR